MYWKIPSGIHIKMEMLFNLVHNTFVKVHRRGFWGKRALIVFFISNSVFHFHAVIEGLEDASPKLFLRVFTFSHGITGSTRTTINFSWQSPSNCRKDYLLASKSKETVKMTSTPIPTPNNIPEGFLADPPDPKWVGGGWDCGPFRVCGEKRPRNEWRSDGKKTLTIRNYKECKYDGYGGGGRRAEDVDGRKWSAKGGIENNLH